MSEKEKLMYEILGKISIDAPIVFKGALITKLILAESGYTDVQRMTKDIDANWVGSQPSMADIRDTYKSGIGRFKRKIHCWHIS